MPNRVTINDSSEAELFTAANPGQVAVAAGATSKVDANIQVGDLDVANGNPVPVSDAAGSLTVDGTVVAQDGGGSLTVDQVSADSLNTNANLQVGDADVSATNPVPTYGVNDPDVDSFSSAVVNLAASTPNQVLVAAPGANKQIWVYGLFMMADTAAGTVTLQDEDDTALSGTMAVSDEGGFVLPMSGNFAMPWIKVATAKALEADTGACTVDGVITYAIVSV